jgi:hypothetical protein
VQGNLEVIRRRPHFIQFLLSLSLEEGIDNLGLSRRIESAVTIHKMRKDTNAGAYLLDYIVPLHTLVGSASYLIDDIISVERCLPGQRPQVLATIRLSLTKEGEFLCARTIPLTIQERLWEEAEL